MIVHMWFYGKRNYQLNSSFEHIETVTNREEGIINKTSHVLTAYMVTK